MNFYRDASTIIDKIQKRQGSIKGLTLNPNVKDKKKMYALVCETLKSKSILRQVITNSKLTEKEKRIKHSLALVLVHDLLFHPRGIQAPSGPIKEAITKYQTRLKAELIKLQVKHHAKSPQELIENLRPKSITLPRYLRVNTLLSTKEEVISTFIKQGYQKLENYDPTIKTKFLVVDKHIDNVLILSESTDLYKHKLLKQGKIILQDKASCFPAYILNPPPGSHVIDACAAPGNKTTHLTMLMKNSGKIFALDLSLVRLNTLKKAINLTNCKIVEPIHQSFLDLDPLSPMYSKVEYILLDPSCSGSGIANRMDELIDDDENEAQKAQRLEKLAQFQLDVILHAFKFPSVKKVSYSTCSIHPTENEHVVNNALNANSEFQLAPKSIVLPNWNHRGLTNTLLNPELADRIVRADPSSDFTNGFFVALFIRKSFAHFK